MCMWCICIPFEWHFTAFTCIQLHVLRCHITAFLWVAYYLILGSFHMRFILSLVHCFAFYSLQVCCIIMHFDAWSISCIMLHYAAFRCILMHFDAFWCDTSGMRPVQNVSECIRMLCVKNANVTLQCSIIELTKMHPVCTSSRMHTSENAHECREGLECIVMQQTENARLSKCIWMQ